MLEIERVLVFAYLQAQISNFKINYCILVLKTIILHKLLNIICQIEYFSQIKLRRPAKRHFFNLIHVFIRYLFGKGYLVTSIIIQATL